MEIVEQRQGAVTVVRPRGPLVLDDAEVFKSRLGEVMTRSLGRFVVDMSEVPYLDSRGLEVLKETTDELLDGGHRALVRLGRGLPSAGSNVDVRRHVDEVARVGDERAEAVGGVRGPFRPRRGLEGVDRQVERPGVVRRERPRLLRRVAGERGRVLDHPGRVRQFGQRHVARRRAQHGLDFPHLVPVARGDDEGLHGRDDARPGAGWELERNPGRDSIGNRT